MTLPGGNARGHNSVEVAQIEQTIPQLNLTPEITPMQILHKNRWPDRLHPPADPLWAPVNSFCSRQFYSFNSRHFCYFRWVIIEACSCASTNLHWREATSPFDRENKEKSTPRQDQIYFNFLVILALSKAKLAITVSFYRAIRGIVTSPVRKKSIGLLTEPYDETHGAQRISISVRDYVCLSCL